MSANDVQKIITEVVQGLIALLALASVVFFQANHQPVPDIIYFVLGGALLALGVKIGIPLVAPTSTVLAQSEVTNHAQVPG